MENPQKEREEVEKRYYVIIGYMLKGFSLVPGLEPKKPCDWKPKEPEKELTKILGFAKGEADNGYLSNVEFLLECAQRCATELGRDITDMIKDIKTPDYYKVLVEQELGVARGYAFSGIRETAENALNLAKAYASEGKIDIDKRVQEIETILKTSDS